MSLNSERLRHAATVRCHQWGDPAEVLELEQLPLPEVGPGQVLVRMKAAPINPADINVIEGKYGFAPPLPACCGNEGAGVVEELGPGVTGLEVGQLVRPVPGVGTWRQALVADADQLTPLPASLEPEQAAVMCVNAATAWRMLHDFASLEPGDWVIQNAATSAVGKYVIQLCRTLDLRTVNVVRRESAAEELRALGADVVLTEEVKLSKKIRELTGGAPVKLGLNGVGGKSAANLFFALGKGGTLVTYGAMGRQPVSLPNGPLIFSELTLAGFWVTAWYERATQPQTDEMLGQLAARFADGALDTFVERRYPLERIHEAMAHARQEGRRGKVLLTLD